jgi:hypothetical protein
MELITRPHQFIKDELGDDVTLIYGDVRGRNVMLYSAHPLSGYHADGDAYLKVLSADDDIIKTDGWKMADKVAFPTPLLQKSDAELFGTNGVFGYVGSKEAFRFFQPRLFRCYESKGMIGNDYYPDDVALVHEGAHLAFHPHMETLLFPVLSGLVSGKFAENGKRTVAEALAMVPQMIYVERFHSLAEGKYHDYRRSCPPDSLHADAYRISIENRKEIEDMMKAVKMANKSGF